jgi:hypothetical protein
MGGEDRRRRKIFAQGFAAAALFVFAHGAHAATTPVTATASPSAAVHYLAV